MSEVLHIYTRVSSAAQEDAGTSLETQRELGTKKAKELGMVPKVWNEGGESSRFDDFTNRPQLSALLAAVDSGDVKHIWVFNTDRLSRNDTTWGVIRLKLLKQSVTLHTQSGLYQQSNPTDKLMLGILSEISSYDNALRAERSRMGKINRLKAGYWMGGPPPFGYKIEGKMLVPDPEEAKWVEFIFKCYCDGVTVLTIRKKLMEHGVKTRRKKSIWSLGSIEALLTNSHYAGHYVVRDKKTGENIQCSCPPIISPTLSRETARKKELRSKRRVRESNQKHFYLLRDFLVCDHCDSRFSGRTYAKQYRSVYYCPRKERNYVNSGTDKVKKCTNSRYLKIEETDELVWQTVVKVLSDSAQFKEWFKKDTLGAKGSHEDRAVEVNKLQKQMKALDTEIRSIGDTLATLDADRLLKRRTPEEVEKIITQIEKHRVERRAKRDEIEGKIHSLQSRQKWVNWITEFGERINQMNDFTPKERHELLGRVVKEIRVKTLGIRSHRLTIKFTLPYHGDSFNWNSPKERSKGYTITGGSDQIDLTVTDAKKKHLSLTFWEGKICYRKLRLPR